MIVSGDAFRAGASPQVDMDAKGGAAISIAHTRGKPMLFLGTGQKYRDLVKFDAGWYVDQFFG